MRVSNALLWSLALVEVQSSVSKRNSNSVDKNANILNSALFQSPSKLVVRAAVVNVITSISSKSLSSSKTSVRSSTSTVQIRNVVGAIQNAIATPVKAVITSSSTSFPVSKSSSRSISLISVGGRQVVGAAVSSTPSALPSITKSSIVSIVKSAIPSSIVQKSVVSSAVTNVVGNLRSNLIVSATKSVTFSPVIVSAKFGSSSRSSLIGSITSSKSIISSTATVFALVSTKVSSTSTSNTIPTPSPGTLSCQPGTYSSTGRNPCNMCSPGSVSTLSLATSCSPCLAGTFAGNNSTSCISCNAGTYSLASASTCTICAPGYISGPSASACSYCFAGTYAAGNGTNCALCSAGTYSNHLASKACNLCQLGFFSDSDGSISCDTCQPKTFTATKGAIGCTNCNLSPGSNTCDPQTGGDTTCITGFGLSSPGKTYSSCTACPIGSYSPQGGTICNICIAGTTSIAGSGNCIACQAGTISIAGGSCFNCSAGSDSTTASGSCSPCVAGTFSAGNGALCSPCIAGTYTSNIGNVECLPCGAGSFSSKIGSVSCTNCPPFTYSKILGALYCVDCDIIPQVSAGCNPKYGNDDKCAAGYGLLLPNASYNSCTICPIGTFSIEGGTICELCSAGMSSPKGYAFCYLCQVGTISVAGGSCTECPAGTFSSIGAASCSPCVAGTFSMGYGGTCTPCPGGSYNPSASFGNTQCLTCPAGTSSNILGATSCIPCLSGTYSDGTLNAPTSGSSCTICPSLFSSSNPGSGITCDPKSGADTTCLIGTGLQPSSITPNKCTACFVGTISPGIVTTCSPCSAGTTSAGNSNVCFNCPAGTRGVTGRLCVDCINNTFSSSGQTQCTNCPVHTGSVAGSGSCDSCPDKQTSTPGSGCAFCPPGSDLFGFECNRCFPGYFAIGNDGNRCLACPTNTYNTLRNQTSCLDCPSGLTSLPGSSECLPSYNLLILDQNSQALGYLSAPSNYQGTFQVGPRDGSITFFSPKKFSPGSFVELFMQNSPGRSALGVPESSDVFDSYSATLTGVDPHDPVFVNALQRADKRTYGRSLIWKMGAASNGQYSVSVQNGASGTPFMGYSNGGTIGAQAKATLPVVTFVLDPLPTS